MWDASHPFRVSSSSAPSWHLFGWFPEHWVSSLKMSQLHVAFAIIQLFGGALSAQEYQFSRWSLPRTNLGPKDVIRRQTPPPGYHPEFGSCGSGTTCENACGANWESCQASTTLSLFCYNKVDLGQTCCENGSGRACDRGYYCAWQEFGGKVWCCEDGQSLEECGVPTTASSSITIQTSTTSQTGNPTGSSSSSPTDSPTSGSSSRTGTDSRSSSPTSSEECPGTTATVTSWATTTILSTVRFEVTVTECRESYAPSPTSEDCLTFRSSHSNPHGSTPVPTGPSTITEPPSHASSTTHKPPFNTTTTSSLVTGGSGSVRASLWALGLAAVGFVLV